jgi:peptide/nickel transport system ATP-binding protein
MSTIGPDTSLLRVRELSVQLGSRERPLSVVDRASFDVKRGETVCLVGESGSGKTLTALSILRLAEERRARIVGGKIELAGSELGALSPVEIGALRGRRIGMIFQEPMTAFDPLFSIGEQIVETILRHERTSREEASERAVRLLERVHIPEARLRMGQIPEQLSGGMRQRAMIAMALACRPDLLIADEPTTALDVTIESQILALLKKIQREDGMGILLITHDLGVAAAMADRVVVMYAGRVVEDAPVEELFGQPAHPYTRGLLRSAVPHDSVRGTRLPAIGGSIPRLEQLPAGCRFHPRCPEAIAACRSDAPATVTLGSRRVACFRAAEPTDLVVRPAVERVQTPGAGVASLVVPEGAVAARVAQASALVEAREVSKHYELGGGWFAARRRVYALDEISLQIAPGETLGLVGESGCGKSTLGRVLLQLEAPSSGEVRFDGRPAGALGAAERRSQRSQMQMIFQDPYGSLDPRWKVGDIIAEPLLAQGRLNKAARAARVEELLELVGLESSARGRHAHEFSGGQRQRIGIARAIATSPRFVVADEAVSALDLSVQAQIINLLEDLRARLGLTTLFIGHGLHVVRHLSDRIGVMYLGRLVEVAPADRLFRRPLHHYSHVLVSSVPVPDPKQRRQVAPLGELPSPSAPPRGCHFHPRCPAATERCKVEAPKLKVVEDGRAVACHFPRG